MRSSVLSAIGLGMLLTCLLMAAVALNAHALQSVDIAGPAVDGLLTNADFECSAGYYSATNSLSQTVYVPNHWFLQLREGAPIVHSARTFFSGGCTGNGHVERISGEDSLVVRSQDIETPPAPGKPFDAIVYQQVPVISGTDYSLSGWLLSLCGGSALPSDCPDGFYIAKLLGIDPTGGIDPSAGSVIWAESRSNFVDENGDRVGWTNLRTSAQAQTISMTVFARIDSPFRHHGNHGFIDALSLMPAPTATLGPLPAVVTGTRQLTLTWQSTMPVEIASIPNGTYELSVDLEVRHAGAAEWAPLIEDNTVVAGERLFSAKCVSTSYEFRIRARAEQPPAPPQGATPNQRYPGVWSEPVSVLFASEPVSPTVGPAGPFTVYLPLLSNAQQC